MNKKGRFLNPADRYRIFPLDRRPGRNSLKFLISDLETEIEEIPVRDRIFSDELKSLTGNILSHEKGDQYPVFEAEESSSELEVEIPEIPEALEIAERERADLSGLFKTVDFHSVGAQRYFHLLTEMCVSPEIDPPRIEAICRYFQKLSGCQAFAILAFDAGKYLYRVIAERGLDDITRLNLCFRLEDPYLNFEIATEMLHLRSHLKNDLNFNKRFGTDFLYRMNGIIFCNLAPHGCPAFLTMFYRNPELIDESAVAKKIAPYIEYLIPIIERMRAQIWKDSIIDAMNIWSSIETEMRKLNSSNLRKLHVVYLSFYSEGEGNRGRIERINYHFLEDALFDNERMLVIGPGRVLVIGTAERPERFQEIASDMARNLGLLSNVQILKFPENGRNILNFIQTGPEI
jgi:hypothetical protein